MELKNMNKLGRLAMRKEGVMWNAYYALPDTMEGAALIGSIAIAFVANNPERKQAFMDMMSGIVADHIETSIGQRPSMDVTDAPEHERSGNA
jgi:hypothetical protein